MTTDNHIRESDVSFTSPAAIIAMLGITPLVLLLLAFPAYFAYNLLEFVLHAVLIGPTR